MKTLASCAAIAGVTIGVMWNGHGTQTLGAYLLLVAVVWITANALFLLAWPWLARRMQASLEREIPSREYADWFLGEGSDRWDEALDQVNFAMDVSVRGANSSLNFGPADVSDPSGPVPPTACPGGGATSTPAHTGAPAGPDQKPVRP